MSRSLKKGPYIDEKLMKKVDVLNDSRQKKVIKTWARDCTIPPGRPYRIHAFKRKHYYLASTGDATARYGDAFGYRLANQLCSSGPVVERAK